MKIEVQSKSPQKNIVPVKRDASKTNIGKTSSQSPESLTQPSSQHVLPRRHQHSTLSKFEERRVKREVKVAPPPKVVFHLSSQGENLKTSLSAGAAEYIDCISVEG